MSYDSTTDALIAGLRIIAKSRVNNALAATLGADYEAVRFVQPYPAPLDQVPAMKLPGMTVHRRNDVAVTTGRRVDRKSRIEFQYWAPPTPLSKLDNRWSLLWNVAEELFDALCSGVDPDTGKSVFDEIGLVKVDDTTWRVEYNFATGGDNAYPVFLASVDITWRRVKVNNAPWLKELLAKYHLEGHAANPLVSDLERLTAWTTGFSSGFGLTPD